MGAVGGTICFVATGFIKNRLKIDDSLDVFAVHGVGGILDSLLVAFFALPALGGSGFGHDLNGPQQVRAQVLGVGAAIVWSVIGTAVIIKLLDMTGRSQAHRR
jgi:Amt family ammonium transporter